ncbi:ATPase, histidine kinase-, DNA gyrase B-, and HSP90-like domain protein [Synechococcus sp. PCC 7335]|uniref:two-component system sensor histidine kinase NblS n=1 Tax=Synechococcus sp. (strain ATCC 29403 / PCC 7335) TaxID=91464 RepID=UPI00017ED20F|nr:ATP-binding protein [Synechococcus sp. PCC 7335]EDX85899.1 ATPase, histidine kinase-, DNA gyrase B-, and HSP90-like domain protein [Synechococcus sp. PCC 7335]
MQLLTKIKALLATWWSDFTLQTRLMAGATLLVSLIMSGLTFWAVNTIQQDTQLNDTRFGRDLGILLAANAAPLIETSDRAELARFSYTFYENTSNVRYMLYADQAGEIFFGIPYSEPAVQNSLTLRRRMKLPDNYASSDSPLVRQHMTPAGVVTDVFVPLVVEGDYKGMLAMGITPNPTVVASSHLTRDVTVAVFVSIWVMVILGAVINALTITQPIKELLTGVKNIAAGNFKQRIDLPLGGELGELIYSFNDMAERLERYEEQNIEELTAEKAKLESLVSTIADGAILLDAKTNLILANVAARRLLGWEAASPPSGSILDGLQPEVRAQLAPALAQALISEAHEGSEFRILLDGNRTIRVLLNTVLDQSRANVKGMAITLQDITREVALNEAKSQFISNVSHELRTPLFNIKSFIETLHEYGEDLSEQERREFLATANNETDRLTRLVNDVLDLSRLESNRRYEFSAVEVHQPIDQVLRTYQLNAKDKQIELASDIESALPAVLGNYDLLLQVFGNLVGNALKFTPAGGKVVIRAYHAPSAQPNLLQSVRIEIGDTGIGIDDEDQAAIFERFFRVENRVHTLEGTGLGLSIVKNIMDKHNSQINLVGEVGVGTTFWFDLPVYDLVDERSDSQAHLVDSQHASSQPLENENTSDELDHAPAKKKTSEARVRG